MPELEVIKLTPKQEMVVQAMRLKATINSFKRYLEGDNQLDPVANAYMDQLCSIGLDLVDVICSPVGE